ncbi:glycosyltransferase family 4 protein [Bifidobacterium sp. ESL0769]|uniref:glycosyltransferase family 4 protein n=1 Tax=Bifidobacterium sp. ESL0769 TaxID=2983229 RepID=UPI0023F9BAC1|nr:glycosyltransferase family 4 protein [Bifidobacterium sp. ESL0769]WEV67735.1 glycosyltransferase family 4 protein [Bifidobacterium sp. ESL0769]
MRICYIGHKRIPSREGGIEVVVTELAARLAQRGEDVVVFNRKGHNVAGREFDAKSTGKSRETTYKGARVIYVPTLDFKGLAALTSSFFATLKAIRLKPDVIHYHAEGPSVMLLLAKLAGVHTVATVHGLDWKRAKWGGFAKTYIKLGEKIIAHFADEIIVLNSDTQQYFIQRYHRQTQLIPNGIEPKVSVPSQRIYDSFGLTKGSYILYLGRIVPEKGIEYLLGAFKQIKTPVKLVIAGGASDSQDYFEKIERLASQDKRVIITGFVHGNILAELYSNAYVYVLPSDIEGMPMSLLEAMSYGNCCLVSDIPGCVDVVGDHALLFKHGSVQDLKDHLQKLLDNPVLVNKYKNQASSYITQKYNWNEVVERTIALYKKAVH